MSKLAAIYLSDIDDYVPSATQIVIAPGATSGVITVTASPDSLVESRETVIVDIANVTNGTESGTQRATATIIDGSDSASGCLYILDGNSKDIHRKCDEVVHWSIVTGLNNPDGIAVDPIRGQLYWTDIHTIWGANLDGSNRRPVVEGLDLAYGVDVDGEQSRQERVGAYGNYSRQ